MPDHILGHAGLTDGDAQFEQLTVDMGRTPERAVATHPANQIPHLAGNNRSSYSAPSHLPGPKQAKSLPMPRDHRLRPDEDAGADALAFSAAPSRSASLRPVGVRRLTEAKTRPHLK